MFTDSRQMFTCGGEPSDGSGDPSPLTVGQFQNNYRSFIGGNKV